MAIPPLPIPIPISKAAIKDEKRKQELLYLFNKKKITLIEYREELNKLLPRYILTTDKRIKILPSSNGRRVY